MPRYLRPRQVPRGNVLVLILVGITLILLAYLAIKFFLEPQSASPQIVVANNPTPTPKPVWKTYTNSKYGLSIVYPAYGMVLAEDQFKEGECGNSIKESVDLIQLDNFYEIKIVKWNHSVDEYLSSIEAKRMYDVKAVTVPGVDEGIEVLGLKSGAEVAVGYPPLVYVAYILKKGENLFIIKDLAHPTNIGGCINQRFLDPVKHAHFLKQKWEITGNIKFSPIAH